MRITESQLRRTIRKVIRESFVDYSSLSDSDLILTSYAGDPLASEEYRNRVSPEYFDDDIEIKMPSRRHRFFESDN